MRLIVDLHPILSLKSYAYSIFRIRENLREYLFLDVDVVVCDHPDSYERPLLSQTHVVSAFVSTHSNHERGGLLVVPVSESVGLSFLVVLFQGLVGRGIRDSDLLNGDRTSRWVQPGPKCVSSLKEASC